MLFGGAFQSPQRAGRPGGDPPVEDFLDKSSPPAWREVEVELFVTRLECASIGVI
jgi:hypothetical protein